MKELHTRNGAIILVSDCDFELVNAYVWTTLKRSHTTYAIHARKKTTLMHRLIMKPGADQVVDHIDHNGLNNQRSNLRLCSRAENARNNQGKRDRAGYKGVYRSGNSWQALINVAGKLRALGRFKNPEDAARAYDKAAREHFGAFATTNFGPESHNTSYVNSTINTGINSTD